MTFSLLAACFAANFSELAAQCQKMWHRMAVFVCWRCCRASSQCQRCAISNCICSVAFYCSLLVAMLCFHISHSTVRFLVAPFPTASLAAAAAAATHYSNYCRCCVKMRLVTLCRCNACVSSSSSFSFSSHFCSSREQENYLALKLTILSIHPLNVQQNNARNNDNSLNAHIYLVRGVQSLFLYAHLHLFGTCWLLCTAELARCHAH